MRRPAEPFDPNTAFDYLHHLINEHGEPARRLAAYVEDLETEILRLKEEREAMKRRAA